MSAVSIRSLWFVDALRDRRLKKAIRRLRLKSGDFYYHEQSVKDYPDDTAKARVFFAEGPRGGIRGILLASRQKDRGPVRIGVFVDRKSRRQNIGTDLVLAARSHYPYAPLATNAWSNTSMQFWTRLRGITGKTPRDYR